MLGIIRWVIPVVPGAFQFMRRGGSAGVFKPKVAIPVFGRYPMEILREVLFRASHTVSHSSIPGKNVGSWRHLSDKEVDVLQVVWS
jgi:hypothetical protein